MGSDTDQLGVYFIALNKESMLQQLDFLITLDATAPERWRDSYIYEG